MLTMQSGNHFQSEMVCSLFSKWEKTKGSQSVPRKRLLTGHYLQWCWEFGSQPGTQSRKIRNATGWRAVLWREPAGHREGAAGQLQECWQKSNSSGVSPRYLNLLPRGVNPDTVTVQLQKQDQPILLMPSSFQCPLIKQALARLHNGLRSLCNCGRW